MGQPKEVVRKALDRIRDWPSDGFRVRAIQVISVLVIVLGAVILLRHRLSIISVLSNRPFISATKDWIDVFAALGEGFGIVALVALIFEMYRRRDEVRTRFKPQLKISFDLLDEKPAKSSARYLFDETNEDLRNMERDYRELKLAAEAVDAACLGINVVNQRSEAEGAVQDVRIRLRLRYSQSESWTPGQGWQATAWFPPLTQKGLRVDPEDTQQMVLKLGRREHPYFSAEIIDFKCKNQRGDSFGETDVLVPTRAFEQLTSYERRKEVAHDN